MCASALVGGMEALLSGTTTLIDHHASPNAIDGSLDAIEDALGSLGVRSCSATRPPTETAPIGRGAGSPRTGASSSASAASNPRSRAGWSARTRRSRSPTTRSGLRRSRARPRRRPPRPRRRGRASTPRPSRGSRARARLDARTLLAHGVHLDDDELELVAGPSAVDRPQRALEHEQLGRAGARRRRSACAWRSAPTGSASTCSRSRTRRSSGCARTTSAPASGWPLAPLARGRAPRRADLRRAAARGARAGSAGRPGRARLCRAHTRRRSRASRATGSSGSRLALRPRRDGRGRMGPSSTGAWRASTSASSPPTPAQRRRASGGGSTTSSPIPSPRKEA